jgi:2-oxoglutarate ferredoxin oxidoreductase subunit alpha
MNELIGFAYYAEIPAVIVDVQRTGPSTGMPTRTQQADLLACAYASHGDTKHLLLFPADPGECFEFAVKAFDLAERFQTPVLVLTDLDIGMNDWVVPELSWDDAFLPDRGRVLTSEELHALPRFHRYADEDAEFVTPRTLPGAHPGGAYFVRGSGHDKRGAYTEAPDSYQQVVDRLSSKHAAAALHVPAPVVHRREGARIGVVSLGSGDLAVLEAAELLAQRGVVIDVMRVRGFPFPASVRAFLDEHEMCFVVEQNRDAQLRSLLVLETGVSTARLRSVLVYGGLPLSAQHVVDSILTQTGNQ